MGVVHRGRDTLVGREVALKEIVLPSILDDDERAELRSLMLREARTAVGFSHPGAVRVYDVVEHDGAPVVVMEMVYAPTLEQLVRRDGPMAPGRVAAIGLDLLDVLEAAHRQGIIHRHVAPSNVIVPPYGPARLADFGITPFVGDPKLVAGGVVGGVPDYFAPEQVGDRQEGPPADIWGLAATLWFAVEGEPPFVVASTAAGTRPPATDVLAAIAAGRLRLPHRAGGLGPVLEEMMSADPAGRPDAGSVRGDLRAQAMPNASDSVAGPSADRYGAGDGPSGDTGPFRSGTEPGEYEPDEDPPPLEPLVAISRMFSPDPAARGAWTPVDLSRGAGLGPHDPAPPPWPIPRRRLRKSATVLCSLVIMVLVALLITNGRLGRDSPEEVAARNRSDQVVVTVPRQWDTFNDAGSGLALSHPPEWAVTQFGATVRFQDPDTGAYVQVNRREPPGPSPTDYAAEAERARVAEGALEYERIRMVPTKFANSDAVIWEFTYDADRARQREIDIGFNTQRYGFALEFRAEVGDWSDLQPVFAAITSSFSVPL